MQVVDQKPGYNLEWPKFKSNNQLNCWSFPLHVTASCCSSLNHAMHCLLRLAPQCNAFASLKFTAYGHKQAHMYINTLPQCVSLVWGLLRLTPINKLKKNNNKKEHSSQVLVVYLTTFQCVYSNLGISIVAKMRCISSGWWKDLGLLYMQ